MAVRYFGTAQTGPQAANRANYVGANTGGTLAGSQTVQIVFDDTVFGATAEGKQRLLDAVQTILDMLASAKTWPIDSTS